MGCKRTLLYNNTHVNNAFSHKKQQSSIYIYHPAVLTQGAAKVALTDLFTLGPIQLLENHPAT